MLSDSLHNIPVCFVLLGDRGEIIEILVLTEFVDGRVDATISELNLGLVGSSDSFLQLARAVLPLVLLGFSFHRRFMPLLLALLHL